MKTTTTARLPLRTLPEPLRARTVLPADARYDRLRHTYAYRGAPAAILLPDTASEVAASLRFARGLDVPLSIRSGGHGISSRSTNDGGIVVDLGRLNQVRVVDRPARRVRIGPGARWGAVAGYLAPQGLAISSGDSGDVGVGGLATTGGLGLMSRRFGLTIDHLRAATILTADGDLRTVDALHDPDLFWGIRGAGANFGIVTSFEFEAAPVGQVVRATIAYDAADAAALLRRWSETVVTAPRAVTAFLYAFPGRPGRAAAAVTLIVHAGDDTSAARDALEPFTRVAPLAGSRTRLVSYAEVVKTTGAPHAGAAPAAARTGLVMTQVDHTLSAELAGLLDRNDVDLLQLRAVGGAVNDVPADATAYAHRRQHFSVMAATSPSRRESLWRRWDALHPLFDGIYLSFETDTRPARLRDAFPEPTLARLRKLKARHDPEAVFSQNFDVGEAV